MILAILPDDEVCGPSQRFSRVIIIIKHTEVTRWNGLEVVRGFAALEGSSAPLNIGHLSYVTVKPFGVELVRIMCSTTRVVRLA